MFAPQVHILDLNTQDSNVISPIIVNMFQTQHFKVSLFTPTTR